MQVEFPAVLDPSVDLTQILPIQQKRTIAFVNHFVMNTVSYLNNFAQSCESRFMEFEYKIQKIEASLLILESQLSSITGLNDVENNSSDVQSNVSSEQNIIKLDLPNIGDSCDNNIPEKEVNNSSSVKPDGTKACDDPRFKKFFKMLQFGVPEPAVKLKMKNEGMDPNILDTPSAILPGLEKYLSESNGNEIEKS